MSGARPSSSDKSESLRGSCSPNKDAWLAVDDGAGPLDPLRDLRLCLLEDLDEAFCCRPAAIPFDGLGDYRCHVCRRCRK